MKIRLTMPGAAIAVEVADHQAKNMFKELAAQLLGMEPVKVVKMQMPVKVAGGTVGTATEAVANPEEREQECTDTESSSSVTEKPENAPVPVSSAVHNATQGFKGFLYIRCENCGKGRGFCAKEPTKSHRCSCGHETELKDLVTMWVRCDCGRQFKYLTNMDGYLFDIVCIDCGRAVSVKWDRVKRSYETVKVKRSYETVK